MLRRVLCSASPLILCAVVSIAYGAPRGRTNERAGGERSAGERGGERRPEGAERKNEGGERKAGEGRSEETGARGPRDGDGATRRENVPGGAWGERTHQGGANAQTRERGNGGEAAAGARAADRNKTPATGAQGAAAGAAAANRRGPNYSGAQGAAAGAAAANRNQPNFSGAQGAAAGAAAANRNQPNFSGAQGAAAGAAAANRNQPNLSGAQGAAVGAAAANRNSLANSGVAGAAVGSNAVRRSFNNYGLYNSGWYGNHSSAWAPGRWHTGGAWSYLPWAAVGGFVGAASVPSYYNYGTNPYYQNGSVMMGDQNLGTAGDFSQQAADLAQTGSDPTPDDNEEWMPLGVFAMVRNEQQHPQLIVELAVNKDGILRGNFTDEVTEHTQPIQGAVDPKTQRVAWTVGDNTSTVMEVGLSNLTSGEAPALVHKNGKTDHWLLVRLNQPAAAKPQ